MTLTVTLDAVKKHRNKSEWRWICRATIGHISVTGDGSLIVPALRLWAAENPDFDPMVRIMRGSTLCFKEAPVSAWIHGRRGRGEQPAGLKEYAKARGKRK